MVFSVNQAQEWEGGLPPRTSEITLQYPMISSNGLSS